VAAEAEIGKEAEEHEGKRRSCRKEACGS
jgi:hypothetical protein